jgi:hypothetical protein
MKEGTMQVKVLFFPLNNSTLKSAGDPTTLIIA